MEDKKTELDDKKIKLYEQDMEYKKGLKWLPLSYEDIENAYLRIEEVNARFCCGRADFDMSFLMLRLKNGVLLKLESFSAESVKKVLEVLKQKNDKIEIGYRERKIPE